MKKISVPELKAGYTSLPVIGVGVAVALTVSLVVFIFSSVFISYTPVPETVVPYLAYITSIISIFTGAFYVTRRLGHKGWLNGGLTGVFYILFLLVLGRFVVGEFPGFSSFLMKIFLGFVFGAVTGIIARNV